MYISNILYYSDETSISLSLIDCPDAQQVVQIVQPIVQILQPTVQIVQHIIQMQIMSFIIRPLK